MLEFCTLASGSRGNCALVSDGSTHLLLDAGISARRICQSLKVLGLEPQALSGVLITHGHTDHISGLATLIKQLRLPVYASEEAGAELCARTASVEAVLHPFRAGGSFSVGGLEVQSFPTPHDAAGSVGYALTAGGCRMALCTDLGHLTPEVLAGIAGTELLIAESNHEEEWLWSGPYPYPLKRRILGKFGHLSNKLGAELACRAALEGAKGVILAHLSAENNTPARAYEAAAAALERQGVIPGEDLALSVAPRSDPGPLYRLERGKSLQKFPPKEAVS